MDGFGAAAPAGAGSGSAGANAGDTAVGTGTGAGTGAGSSPAHAPLREGLVANGVRFLTHPSAQATPLYQRTAFLSEKGLTADEIAEAVRRAGVADGGAAGRAPSAAPASDSGGWSWGSLAIPAALVGALGAGAGWYFRAREAMKDEAARRAAAVAANGGAVPPPGMPPGMGPPPFGPPGAPGPGPPQWPPQAGQQQYGAGGGVGAGGMEGYDADAAARGDQGIEAAAPGAAGDDAFQFTDPDGAAGAAVSSRWGVDASGARGGAAGVSGGGVPLVEEPDTDGDGLDDAVGSARRHASGARDELRTLRDEVASLRAELRSVSSPLNTSGAGGRSSGGGAGSGTGGDASFLSPGGASNASSVTNASVTSAAAEILGEIRAMVAAQNASQAVADLRAEMTSLKQVMLASPGVAATPEAKALLAGTGGASAGAGAGVGGTPTAEQQAVGEALAKAFGNSESGSGGASESKDSDTIKQKDKPKEQTPEERAAARVKAVKECVDTIGKDNEAETVASAASFLVMCLGNLIATPDIPRYRRLATSNANYQRCLEPLKGLEPLLKALGFEQRGSYWQWTWLPNDKDANTPPLQEAVSLLQAQQDGSRRGLKLTRSMSTPTGGAIAQAAAAAASAHSAKDSTSADPGGGGESALAARSSPTLARGTTTPDASASSTATARAGAPSGTTSIVAQGNNTFGFGSLGASLPLVPEGAEARQDGGAAAPAGSGTATADAVTDDVLAAGTAATTAAGTAGAVGASGDTVTVTDAGAGDGAAAAAPVASAPESSQPRPAAEMPKTFAEVMSMVKAGIVPPGIVDVEDRLSAGADAPTAAAMAPRPKPWDAKPHSGVAVTGAGNGFGGGVLTPPPAGNGGGSGFGVSRVPSIGTNGAAHVAAPAGVEAGGDEGAGTHDGAADGDGAANGVWNGQRVRSFADAIAAAKLSPSAGDHAAMGGVTNGGIAVAPVSAALSDGAVGLGKGLPPLPTLSNVRASEPAAGSDSGGGAPTGVAGEGVPSGDGDDDGGGGGDVDAITHSSSSGRRTLV